MRIEVKDHNPQWIEEFNSESEKLRNNIGEVIVKIHHIGSTSVSGLKAKPIIDIMLEVTDLISLDNKRTHFENMKYEVMGEMGIPRRRYYRKGGDNRTHQIHAFASGDSHLVRHLAFRDYLRSHKEIADEYGKLKAEIALLANNDIERYCDLKDAFIKHHEALALTWYKRLND